MDKLILRKLDLLSEQLKQNYYAFSRINKIFNDIPIERTDFYIGEINSDNIFFMLDSEKGEAINFNAEYFEYFPIKVGSSILFEKHLEHFPDKYIIEKCINLINGVEYHCKKYKL